MDIKTRLNRCCGKPIGGYNCHDGMRCSDCFDKLEGLREIEELNERVETLRQVVRDQTAHGVKQMKEIERLREALGGVKDCLEDKNYIDAEMIIDHAVQQKDN